MEIYVVGGAIRDTLLGLEPKDYDFVVVGSSPEEMLSLGFKQVGADFPVFLHPVTGDEYALARTERKVGVGYNGFESSWKGVTLEEDLMRRDLTINSMAAKVKVDLETGEMLSTMGRIIDPYGGLGDAENKVLRHTSEAFAEDPVRILRIARFLSSYGEEWTVATETNKLCLEVWQSGELKYLVPERVWLETEKSLNEKQPQRYFNFLREFEFPFIEIFHDMWNTIENNVYHQEKNVFIHTMMVLEHAADTWNDPEINFACLLHDIAKPICYEERGNGHGHDGEGVPMIEEWCKKWKVPNNYRDLAKITCEQHQKIHSCMGRDTNSWSKPKTIMKIFEQTSALSKPERFKKMLKACESDSYGRIGINSDKPYIQRQYLEECLEAVLSLDTKIISSKMVEQGKEGKIIGLKIREERIRQIRGVQNKWKNKN